MTCKVMTLPGLDSRTRSGDWRDASAIGAATGSQVTKCFFRKPIQTPGF